ncbi:hypothetical protein H4R33_002901 [Dimargaris cristalligena]|nr:hypothetical protein H4R33_002901 [Dimargaris cristalligena]
MPFSPVVLPPALARKYCFKFLAHHCRTLRCPATLSLRTMWISARFAASLTLAVIMGCPVHGASLPSENPLAGLPSEMIATMFDILPYSGIRNFQLTSRVGNRLVMNFESDLTDPNFLILEKSLLLHDANGNEVDRDTRLNDMLYLVDNEIWLAIVHRIYTQLSAHGYSTNITGTTIPGWAAGGVLHPYLEEFKLLQKSLVDVEYLRLSRTQKAQLFPLAMLWHRKGNYPRASSFLRNLAAQTDARDFTTLNISVPGGKMEALLTTLGTSNYNISIADGCIDFVQELMHDLEEWYMFEMDDMATFIIAVMVEMEVPAAVYTPLTLYASVPSKYKDSNQAVLTDLLRAELTKQERILDVHFFPGHRMTIQADVSELTMEEFTALPRYQPTEPIA